MSWLILALLLQLQPALSATIPSATRAPGAYTFGPFDVPADTQDLAVSCSMDLHSDPASEVSWQLFVSYDGSDPLGKTGQFGGGGNMRGGQKILDDDVLTSAWHLIVGLDALKPHDQVKVKIQARVTGAGTTVGDCSVKSLATAGGRAVAP